MPTFDQIAEELQERNDFEHGHGVSPDAIAQAERELGVEFPTSYRAFLGKFGWAGLGSSDIYGLGDDVPKWMDVVKLTKSERTEAHPNIPVNLVPILNDGGGNHHCIDTSDRLGKRAPIVFWDHESGADQVPDVIAENFTDWLVERMQRGE